MTLRVSCVIALCSVSVVYKATCATTKREVIVKAYKIHRMTSKQIHKTKREISLMRMLR